MEETMGGTRFRRKSKFYFRHGKFGMNYLQVEMLMKQAAAVQVWGSRERGDSFISRT